jgi:hypothetical protein
MPALFRVDAGYRTKVKQPRFYIEYVVAETQGAAFRTVLARRADILALLQPLLEKLPNGWEERATDEVATGTDDVRAGRRMLVEPSCVQQHCSAGDGAAGCQRRFGDDQVACANSLYVFSAALYASVLELPIAGYRLVPVSDG